jgi:hypothetical protein
MDRFDIWGQVQEIARDRYLALAIACPDGGAEGQGQTVFSKVLDSRVAATRELERLMRQLEEQVRSAGEAVIAVHALDPNLSVDRPGAWFSGAMPPVPGRPTPSG